MQIGQIFGNMGMRMKLRKLTNKHNRQIKALATLDMPETKALEKKIAQGYAAEYKAIINAVDPLKVPEANGTAAPVKKKAPVKKAAVKKAAKKSASKKTRPKAVASGDIADKEINEELG